jgi:hypothetical protein
MSQSGIFVSSVLPPGGVVETIQGNSGGPISPDVSNNIHVVGDGTTITITGNAGTNTLTASVINGGGSADEFITDAGTAIPVAGVLNVIGGQGIAVSGAGNTVTVASTGLFFNYIDVTMSPYFILDSDVYLSVNSNTIPITILLPDNAVSGEPFIIKDRTGNCAANNITVTTVSGLTTIDGVTSFVMDSAYQSISIVGNGTTYELY